MVAVAQTVPVMIIISPTSLTLAVWGLLPSVSSPETVMFMRFDRGNTLETPITLGQLEGGCQINCSSIGVEGNCVRLHLAQQSVCIALEKRKLKASSETARFRCRSQCGSARGQFA